MEFHVAVPPKGAEAGAWPAPTAAAAEPPRRNAAKARAELAKVLLGLGFAAAGLSLLSLTLTPESSRFMGACAPTEAEAAFLRSGSELLLLAEAAQVLAAAVALLLPARVSALAATALGAVTAYRAAAVLLMLAGCHGPLCGRPRRHVRGGHGGRCHLRPLGRELHACLRSQSLRLSQARDLQR